MSKHYFIIADGKPAGPYDLVSIVKRIRNGVITADTLVAETEDSQPKKASEWPDLLEFLQEQETSVPTQEVHKIKVTPLLDRLRHGWNFLQENQLCTIFSGLFVLLIMFLSGLIAIAIPKALQMICYSLSFIILQYCFTGYMYSVLRMVRGQPVDFRFVAGKMKPQSTGLLTCALLMSFFTVVGLLVILGGAGSVSSFIGLAIIALPGFYVMSLFIFAPLLILDKGMDIWEALEPSYRTVNKSGIENMGVLFSLLIINFLAGVVYLIPMIVSLPITISAVSDMYDEWFG